MQKKWLNDCKSQRWWMTSRKQSSRYNKSDTGIHPQWLWHKNKTCTGSKRQSPWDGKWTQSPIDNQENFCNWYLLEKKILFSPVWRHNGTGLVNHTPKQAPRPGIVGQHRIDSVFFMSFLFYFVPTAFFFLFICSWTFCLFA